MSEVIEIYTDGAAQGNPGRGGYGVVLKYRQHRKELSQGYRRTTNNRMELLAAIVGLESVTNTDIEIHLYSDSKYVVDAVNLKWVFGWQKTQFKGKKNEDLWRRFLDVYRTRKVKMIWIKGHAGHPENERCDQLAVASASGQQLLVDHVYENLAQ